VEIRGLSREDLRALIEGSTREIPTTEHRRLHQEASDFVRWGRRGAKEPFSSTADRTSRCSLASGGAHRSKSAHGAPCWKCRGRVAMIRPHVYNHGVRIHNRRKRRIVEEIIGQLPELTDAQLGRLEEELRRERLRRASSGGGGTGLSPYPGGCCTARDGSSGVPPP
jgi:hypothetical protein